MFEQLFGSKTRVKILNLFLNNDERSFYVREITRKIDEQINSVRRELSNLKNLNILTSKSKNGKLYYTANPHMDLFPELKKMFQKIGMEISGDNDFAKEVKKTGVIRYCALMGKFVEDKSNKIDIFLVGEVDKRKFNPVLKELEKETGKEINYTIFSYGEYRDRKMLFDRFITEIFSVPQEVLINNLESKS